MAASRVLLARPLRRGAWRIRAAKGGQAVCARLGRRAEEPYSAWLCRATTPHGESRDGKRGARRSLDCGHQVSRGPEFKCENTKFCCVKRNNLACVERKRPPDRSSGRLYFQGVAPAQLAATARPARTSVAATRSTSASAAVRASATHFSSITVRPKV